MDLTRSFRDASKSAIYIFFKSPHPKTLKISIFRVPNEVRSSLFPWWKLCTRSLLHCIFCWLHWTSLMVVILEVDAIEGVAFHYVDNFTMLILVVSNMKKIIFRQPKKCKNCSLHISAFMKNFKILKTGEFSSGQDLSI